MVEELRGNLGRALQLIGEGVRLADDSPRREGHQDPLHVVQGSILMELDRLQDARSTLQAGMRVSEELGAHWHLPFYEAYLALERFLAGGWDDASAELDAALQLVAATGEHHSLVLIESLSSLIALHRGDQRHAEEAVARAEHELSDTGPRFRSHWATWARALVLEAGGATEQAFAALAGCWDLCADAGFAIEYPVLGPDLVRLALASGERARAEQVAAAVADVAAGNDVPSIAGSALRCRGLVEGDLAFCGRPWTPTHRVPAPSSWPSPPRTPAWPAPVTARSTPPCPCWSRPSPATSRWRPAATPPVPKRGYATWGSAVAAGARAGGPRPAGRA